MSSVHKAGDSPFWWIKSYDPRTKKYTYEKTPHKIDSQFGKRRALQMANSASRKPGKHGPGWHDWVVPWIESQYTNAGTRKRYINGWTAIAVFLQDNKVDCPADLAYRHAQEYLTWRMSTKRHRGTPIARNTALFELKVLSRVMREAVRREYVPANPLYQMGLQRAPTKKKRALTLEEIARCREQLKRYPEWMQISFEIAIHQGCRIAETQLAFSDIDMNNNVITFHGKGRNGLAKIFSAPLHPGLKPLLQRIKDTGATHTCKISRMYGKDWWNFFRDPAVNLPDVSFHCTRVTVITMLARAKVPIQQAKAYVGHASDAIHDIYLRLAPTDVSGLASAITV